jgi:hypothetical protein
MLNILCEQNLELVAWIIVLVPFILMTEMIIMLVYIFGVNVSNGTIDYKKDTTEDQDEDTKVSYVFVKTPPQGSSSPAYS